jgi:hypothetical protein
MRHPPKSRTVCDGACLPPPGSPPSARSPALGIPKGTRSPVSLAPSSRRQRSTPFRQRSAKSAGQESLAAMSGNDIDKRHLDRHAGWVESPEKADRRPWRTHVGGLQIDAPLVCGLSPVARKFATCNSASARWASSSASCASAAASSSWVPTGRILPPPPKRRLRRLGLRVDISPSRKVRDTTEIPSSFGLYFVSFVAP